MFFRGDRSVLWTSVLISWLKQWFTWRRLFFVALAAAFTVLAARVSLEGVKTFLERTDAAIHEGLASFDALKFGNSFARHLVGCRLTLEKSAWYACDGEPFWRVYTTGKPPAPGTLEGYTVTSRRCLINGCQCEPFPNSSHPQKGVLEGGLWGKPCLTAGGQPGHCRWECKEWADHVYVPHALLYPVFVPAHILWTVLSEMTQDSSTLGAIFFAVLVAASGIAVLAFINFDWEEHWYWSLAGLLLLTPLTASLAAFALKMVLVLLGAAFSSVAGVLIWLIAVGGGAIKAAALLYGILQQGKSLDELTSAKPVSGTAAGKDKDLPKA